MLDRFYRDILTRAIPLTALLGSCTATERSNEFIADLPACDECRIRHQDIVELRIPTSHEGALPLSVRRDADGRYWVFRGSDVPLLFAPGGGFMKPIGRAGSGPGEYTGATDLLVVAPDTLLVMDSRSRRATLLSRNLIVERTYNLPIAARAGVLMSWPEAIVVNGISPASDSVAPLHVFSFAQDQPILVQSFFVGSDSGPVIYPLQSRYHLARQDTEHFWAAWENDFDLELFNTRGSSLKRLLRRPSWFSAMTPVSYDWRNDPPPSYVGGLNMDSDGRLWVFVRVASARWKEAWAHVPAGAAEARPIHELLHSTIVEVIDPERAAVIARLSLDDYLIGAVPGTGAVFLRPDDNGERRIIVRTFELIRSP